MLTRTIAYLTIIVVLLAPGCGGESELGECPPNSNDQQIFGSQTINTCVGCHSSQLEGTNRRGAPVGTDYDIPDIIRRDAEEIYTRARDRLMPPPVLDMALNELQVENLRIFLACGAEAGQPQP